MVDTGDSVHALAAYLGVKCGKITYDGPEKIPVMKGKTGTRRGFTTITKHLARAAEKGDLLGVSSEEKAVIDQWLEFKVCEADRCTGKTDQLEVLRHLDTYLTDKVYFLAHRLTLIDLVLYYGLHSYLNNLTFYEKQKFMHVSRWFDNLQQLKAIRQTYSPVTFSKTQLYSGSAH